jgi:hypothetical protein
MYKSHPCIPTESMSIQGRYFDIDVDIDEKGEEMDVTFFYVGGVGTSESTCILVQCGSFCGTLEGKDGAGVTKDSASFSKDNVTKPKIKIGKVSVLVFDPMVGFVDWKWSVMKRYRQVELLKDCKRVGVVVGTLSVGMYI